MKIACREALALDGQAFGMDDYMILVSALLYVHRNRKGY